MSALALAISCCHRRDQSGKGELHRLHSAIRSLNHQIGRAVEVRWQDHQTQEVHWARAIVNYPPTWSYVWSCVWFLQELLIFAVGGACLLEAAQ